MAAPTAASGRRAEAQHERRPWSVKLLIGLLIFQGVGAIGGGSVMVVDPSGRGMGWDTGMLVDAPFTSFLWPGIILGVGLGLSALVVAFGVLRRPHVRSLGFLERRTRKHWSWAGSIGLGLSLMGWIVIQVNLITFRSFLQPLMFAVGAALLGIPLIPGVRRHLAIGTRPGPGRATAGRRRRAG
jgi:hypothetical protein